MKTYNVWYRFGTPPWVQQARPELVEATFDIKQVAGETGLPNWPRGWAAYLLTRREACVSA